MFGYIETKRLNIDYLRTKIKISLSVIGVKFSGEKKKKFVVDTPALGQMSNFFGSDFYI